MYSLAYGPRPVVVSASASPRELLPGQPFTVTAVIKNNGDAGRVRVDFSGLAVFPRTHIIEMASGGTARVSSHGRAPSRPGRYYVTVTASPLGGIRGPRIRPPPHIRPF